MHFSAIPENKEFIGYILIVQMYLLIFKEYVIIICV